MRTHNKPASVAEPQIAGDGFAGPAQIALVKDEVSVELAGNNALCSARVLDRVGDRASVSYKCVRQVMTGVANGETVILKLVGVEHLEAIVRHGLEENPSASCNIAG